MGRKGSRARPGRKARYSKCAGCGKRLVNENNTFCVRCEARKEARAELFAKSSPQMKGYVEKEKKMHIPSMDNK